MSKRTHSPQNERRLKVQRYAVRTLSSPVVLRWGCLSVPWVLMNAAAPVTGTRRLSRLRWLLLCGALIAGLFAMHSLSAGFGGCHEEAAPAAVSMAMHADGSVMLSEPQPGQPSASDACSGHEHGVGLCVAVLLGLVLLLLGARGPLTRRRLHGFLVPGFRLLISARAREPAHVTFLRLSVLRL